MSVIYYFRLKCHGDLALENFLAWSRVKHVREPLTVVSASDAIKRACAIKASADTPKALSIMLFTSGDWSVFEDLTGSTAGISRAQWRRLAAGRELLVAGFNDSIACAHYLHIKDDCFVNQARFGRGRKTLRGDGFDKWFDVAAFVEDDFDDLVMAADDAAATRTHLLVGGGIFKRWLEPSKS